ncbi:hypothetical protein [Nonomuraea angiospora]|uniref:NmrA-like domain-containing protein n=1 Tax=Nonomuraea angiospora TaxID=46172 RepID=A0ABR9MH54_9ACTN|nr:hypothetical protein [Nonomuraea angiospora]MBE1592247.1 hypothetical protein [Nonomuraea angiospora]
MHTSTSGAGRHTETPGREVVAAPLNAKAAIEERARTAGFPHWTILKPAFFMDNFLPSMALLSRALGTPLAAPDMTEEQALAAGTPAMGSSHEWLNVAGQPARPQYARDLGLRLTSFEEWAWQHLRPAA